MIQKGSESARGGGNQCDQIWLFFNVFGYIWDI